MYDALTIWNELTLLMVWHLLLFIGLVTIKFIVGFDFYLDGIDGYLKFIPSNLRNIQAPYYLLQICISFLAVKFIGKHSENGTKDDHIIYSINELYGKFRASLNNIVSCSIHLKVYNKIF